MFVVFIAAIIAIIMETGINAKYSGEKLPVIKLVITAVVIPIHGPAIKLIKTVPIESKNIGSCNTFTIPNPVKFIATATGISRIAIKEKSSLILFITEPPKKLLYINK